MAGVRIHHPTLRSCTYLLWEPGYASSSSQGGYRKPKMRPLLIDENGDTIVSPVIWRRLTEAGQVGRILEEFIYLNEVPDPPTLIVGGDPGPAMPTFERSLDEQNRQIRDAIRQIAPRVSSFTIRPSGKYRQPLKVV